MSVNPLVAIRDLLLAGEDLVREGWAAERSDTAPETISRGTVAAAALDRIAQVGASVIDHRNRPALDAVLETLTHLYRDAESVGALPNEQRVRSDVLALRRRDIVARVYVVGALAVYQNAFDFVRPLVLQRPDTRFPGKQWIRETVTALARSSQFEKRSLIPIVADLIRDRPALYRRFRGLSDDLANALCQFDFLQCVIATMEAHDLHACYPNFGAYFKERTEPVVKLLLSKGPARVTVPGVGDVAIAKTIRDLDGLAAQVFFDGVWYPGWEFPDVQAFLARNPEPPA